MISFKGLIVALVLTTIAFCLTGCQMMKQAQHNLMPHRLWKLNNGHHGMRPDDWQS